MNKRTVLVLGTDGMVGRIVYSYLKDTNKFNVLGTSRKNPNLIFLDVTKNKNLKKILRNTNFVINCIGINKVSKESEFYADKINHLFPKKLENLSEKLNFKLIHISTDAVFTAKSGKVSEADVPKPDTLYGKTKLKGETSSKNSLTIRTSILGLSPNKKTDLLEWVRSSKSIISGFDNHTWSGCTNLQLAKFCEYLMSSNNFKNIRKKSNVLHFSPLGPTTKYELIKTLIKVLDKKIKLNKVKSDKPVSRYLSSIYFDKKFYKTYTTNLNKTFIELVKYE